MSDDLNPYDVAAMRKAAKQGRASSAPKEKCSTCRSGKKDWRKRIDYLGGIECPDQWHNKSGGRGDAAAIGAEDGGASSASDASITPPLGTERPPAPAERPTWIRITDDPKTLPEDLGQDPDMEYEEYGVWPKQRVWTWPNPGARYFMDGKFWVYDHERGRIEPYGMTVTHWQPLPAPPEDK